ncbi:MAG: DUF362 domain-containing protein [Verrucomicrobia bacterium]|nr:DUF362 domain-containing protein [Verrucomicrobiota bacterium]
MLLTTNHRLSRRAITALVSALALAFACVVARAAALARNPKADGRVVIVEQPGAVVDFNPQPALVRDMVRKGVTTLAGKRDLTAAWRTFVTPKDTVGIKVFAAPGRYSGTRPAVAQAVIEQLIAAGVPAKQIIIWDKHLVDLRLSGYVEMAERLGVRVAGSSGGGWDEKQSYDSPLLGKPVFGDFEFNRTGETIGRKSFVSKIVSAQCTKLINISPMLNHNLAGVSGNLYGLAAASVDNFIRFENDAAKLASAVPEIVALPVLGDRVALNLTDALICQYEGGEHGLLHYSATLNQLRFSTDPVALDVLSLAELERQRQPPRPGEKEKMMKLYENAALLEIGVAEESRIKIVKVP